MTETEMSDSILEKASTVGFLGLSRHRQAQWLRKDRRRGLRRGDVTITQEGK